MRITAKSVYLVREVGQCLRVRGIKKRVRVVVKMGRSKDRITREWKLSDDDGGSVGAGD